MRKLTKNLRKFYYVEVKNGEYMAWYARFTTVPTFGKRITLIYGLDFEIFNKLQPAEEYIKMQKYIYKKALTCKYRRYIEVKEYNKLSKKEKKFYK